MGCVKRLLLVLTLAGVVAVSGAQAITYGTPDGTAHPNVGAFVYKSPSRGGAYAITCSGSLISPTVFLTAAHCTSFLEANGIHDAYVTFDPVFTQASTFYHGAMHTNPLYNKSQSDPGDIAVIVLDDAVSGITPAQLPTAGLLDQMKKAKTLNGTRFTSVGYGIPHVGANLLSAERWSATGEFNSLTGTWLKISQNPSTGDGGTCSGDSGGPQFMGSVQVSITIKGDSVCRATNVDYRLDTPQARAFLDDYVALP
jgi:V8-like Glu-specific endopeptidase